MKLALSALLALLVTTNAHATPEQVGQILNDTFAANSKIDDIVNARINNTPIKSTDDPTKQMSQMLTPCTVSQANNKNTLTGNCPIAYVSEVAGAQNQIDMSVGYQVTNPQYQTLNIITKSAVNAEITGQLQGDGVLNLIMKLGFNTTTYGNVTVDLTTNRQTSNKQFKMTGTLTGTTSAGVIHYRSNSTGHVDANNNDVIDTEQCFIENAPVNCKNNPYKKMVLQP